MHSWHHWLNMLQMGLHVYTYHVCCDFSLLILFTHIWLHMCFITKEAVTSPSHHQFFPSHLSTLFPWFLEISFFFFLVLLALLGYNNHNVCNSKKSIDVEPWKLLVDWVLMEPSICKDNSQNKTTMALCIPSGNWLICILNDFGLTMSSSIGGNMWRKLRKSTKNCLEWKVYTRLLFEF